MLLSGFRFTLSRTHSALKPGLNFRCCFNWLNPGNISACQEVHFDSSLRTSRKWPGRALVPLKALFNQLLAQNLKKANGGRKVKAKNNQVLQLQKKIKNPCI